MGADSGLDGLQPSTYRGLEGQPHAVVTDAPWAALDLQMLQMVVPMVASMVCHLQVTRSWPASTRLITMSGWGLKHVCRVPEGAAAARGKASHSGKSL